MSLGLSRGRVLDPEGFGIEQSQLPPFEQGRVDPRAWFERADPPFEIEIGTGKGTFLVQQAPLRPQVNYLGIEKTLEFYRYPADRVRRRGLANVRILRADAGEFLRYWCADGVAAVVHLYFSDPWPKKRHHKRRLFTTDVVGAMRDCLAVGGRLQVKSDHDGYAEVIREVLSGVQGMQWISADAPRTLVREAAHDGSTTGDER